MPWTNYINYKSWLNELWVKNEWLYNKQTSLNYRMWEI